MTWRSIICDVSEDGDLDKSKISVGRIMLWIAFAYATHFWFWHPVTEFPETLFWFLGIMIGYNFFKKSVPLLERLINGITLKKG